MEHFAGSPKKTSEIAVQTETPKHGAGGVSSQSSIGAPGKEEGREDPTKRTPSTASNPARLENVKQS